MIPIQNKIKIAIISADDCLQQELSTELHAWCTSNKIAVFEHLAAFDQHLQQQRKRYDFVFFDSASSLTPEADPQTFHQVFMRLPQAELVLLGNEDNFEYLLQLFRAGASGYIRRDQLVEHLPMYLEQRRNGGIWLSPFFAKFLIHRLRATFVTTSHT